MGRPDTRWCGRRASSGRASKGTWAATWSPRTLIPPLSPGHWRRHREETQPQDGSQSSQMRKRRSDGWHRTTLALIRSTPFRRGSMSPQCAGPAHWRVSTHFFSETSLLRLARDRGRDLWLPYCSAAAVAHSSTIPLPATPLCARHHRTSMTMHGLVVGPRRRSTACQRARNAMAPWLVAARDSPRGSTRSRQGTA